MRHCRTASALLPAAVLLLTLLTLLLSPALGTETTPPPPPPPAADDKVDLLAVFMEMDHSANGKIDRAELEVMIGELGLEMSDAELQEILDAMAPKDDSEGGLSEFAETAAQYQEHAESGCMSAPCANHGICQSRRRREESGAAVPAGHDAEYVCTCVSGWRGDHCSLDVDECASNPCANDATCLQSGSDEDLIPSDEPLVPAGAFRCVCGVGSYWGGLHCAEDTRDCLSSPCRNGGACEPCFAGGPCETRRSAADPAFQCDCGVGFAGLLCELDVMECASGPCCESLSQML